MCGITGILDFNGRSATGSTIRKMTDAESHRGPDADGFFVEDGIALGHRRLSIIDLSAAANQPFVDNSGRYVMVFNGEMYNFMDVKKQISDYVFHTNGDSEVLIAAYAKWGPDCIQYFRGMFAFAIWDKQERSLFLCRDRMGVKPLYYYVDGQHFLFASEIRALLASDMIDRKTSTKGLIEFFSYQSIGYPYTAIEGIMQLEAGSCILVKDGKIKKKVYWDLTESKPDFDFADLEKTKQRIRELLLQSVKRRLVSDVPVGAFLSGGIDSSIVVGLMSEASDAQPVTFNIAFQEKEYDESAYAQLIAKKFNTQHHQILLEPSSFLDELPNALDAIDSPSADGVNSYVVSKAIRKNGIVVALSGVGGDELFAGYPIFSQYRQLRQKDWLWKFPKAVRELMASSMSLLGKGDSKTGRMQQLLRLDDGSIGNAYPILRQILSAQQIQGLTHLNEGSPFITALQQELVGKKQKLDAMPLLSQISAAEYLGYTQHTLLKDTDQMSMAVSLEVREPYFDQDLVEFVLAIPDNIKKPSYPKSLMVESVKPLLPEEIVFRKKQGFLFPWELWLKNELRSFCELRIKNMAQRNFIKGDRLLDNWKLFLKGDKRVRWSEIWLFVVLEHWLEKNNVQ